MHGESFGLHKSVSMFITTNVLQCSKYIVVDLNESLAEIWVYYISLFPLKASFISATSSRNLEAGKQ